jgi:hypothetical protein
MAGDQNMPAKVDMLYCEFVIACEDVKYGMK